MVWLEFAAALLLVGIGGWSLSRYGEQLGERFGLGSTWAGLVLLATVTSLPELATGLSAVGLARTPDIAVGSILGSCVFNLLILVVVDFVLDRESIFMRISRNHLLSAGYGVVLLGIVGANLVLEHEGRTVSLGHVGFYTPVVLGVYLLAMRSLHRFERKGFDRENGDREVGPARDGTSRIALRFGLAAAVVVGAGIWLPFIGERIALALGVRETFAGSIFVAFATSMPELAVAIAAVRQGAPNMAVSNLLGSNLFNVAILVPEDLLYLPGPILADVDASHAISAMSAMTMTGIAIVALLVRPRNQPHVRFGGLSAVLIAIYLLNSYVLYLYG